MSEKRTVNWTPPCFIRAALPARGDKPAEPEKELYKGHLVLQLPLSEDRLETVLDYESQRKPEGTDTDYCRDMIKIWRKHKHLVVGADVVRLSDGAKLSLDDVLVEPDLVNIPAEFGGKFILGFGPGN